MSRDTNFAKRLTKGKIAETIFWLMFREKFHVLPFGYEYTMPELIRYRKYFKGNHAIEKIANAPDFIIISDDKKQVWIVDVKYRKEWPNHRMKSKAQETVKQWNDCYYFIATPGGFYFDSCQEIIKNYSRARSLSSDFIDAETQAEHLALLNEFIKI